MPDQEQQLTQFEAWDPLESEGADPGIIAAAQRRQIENILKSYTGYYDLFSELIQNSLDAVEKRIAERDASYDPNLFIRIDQSEQEISVTDNGCGMSETEYKNFLRPNYSFKDVTMFRGCKGVGATYLAYGFNYMQVATKHDGQSYSGVLKNGRNWVEDRTSTVSRPKVEVSNVIHEAFGDIDRGTSITIRLVGENIRPRNLGWLGAETAEQWLSILRLYTAIGGIYLMGETSPKIKIEIEVISPDGDQTTNAILESPEYLWPHEIIASTANISDFLADQKRRVERGQDVSEPPPRFRRLNGLWGAWSGSQILRDEDSDCPIFHRLDESEQEIVRTLGIQLYIFLTFSTDVWDNYNDNSVGLRRGYRILKGGLQLGTKHMPQGGPITIPMTNNIGFQNLAHVVIHFNEAEPDLGRKGFQPDIVRISEKLAVSAVTAFRRKVSMLRKPGSARLFGDEVELDNWIRLQEEHEREHGVVISGVGLFLPTEELPIRSEPLVEQDVVAMFNQMLSSGVIRGIQLVASSQYKQYDGLFRVRMEKPFERYIRSVQNPLGLVGEFPEEKDALESPVKVLEYKHTLNGLIEEIQGEIKSAEDIGLAVVWEMGEKWKEMFDVTSYLVEEHVHHRNIHGTTHSFQNSMSGVPAFQAIVLSDLISYLINKEDEEVRQRELYGGM